MRGLRLAAQSARCTVLLRLHGFETALVTCEGRLPVVYGGGCCRLGRLALRGRTVPVELGAVAGGELAVGDGCFFNQGSSVVASLSITLGEHVRVGDYAAVYDSDQHPVEQGTPVRRAPVSIGRNVWLARGAVVLPGSTIGDHAVVAAGAIVSGEVPARTLVAGSPARVVRALAADDEWRRP
jgi:acetyltransferase-like isoleucine patch superfamily enzyme